MNNINNQQILNQFENDINPSQQLTAEAYYRRDIMMNRNFNDVFEHSMKKLGYHPDSYQTLRNNMFQRRVRELSEYYINNINDNNNNIGNMTLERIHNIVEEQVNHIINLRQQKYNYYHQFLNGNNHQQFYHAMDIGDLIYLGY